MNIKINRDKNEITFNDCNDNFIVINKNYKNVNSTLIELSEEETLQLCRWIINHTHI
jgi:hypothetical protein